MEQFLVTFASSNAGTLCASVAQISFSKKSWSTSKLAVSGSSVSHGDLPHI